MRLRGDSARCTSMKHPLWERLPNELRSRVDELIADDRQLPAIVAIRDTLDQPRPGIYECMDLLAERYAELDQPWFRPSPPLDIDVLARQVAALPHPPDAIEALWDGDSDGWSSSQPSRTRRFRRLAMTSRTSAVLIWKC